MADDSITIQKVVELVLAEEGFEIKAVSNGEEALAAVESFQPDIVLADIEMPKLNGYQLAEQLKGNPRTQRIPVLLLAGAFEPVDEELVKKVGASGYIVKPFESQDLINEINEALAAAPAEEAAPAEAVAEEAAPAEAVAETAPAEAVAEEAAPAGEDLWAMETLEAEAPAEEAEVAAAPGEEPALAEEEPVLAEAEETFGIPEAEEALAGFEEPAPAEETVAEAPPEEAVAGAPKAEAPAVSAEELKASVKEAVAEVLKGMLSAAELREALVQALAPELRQAAEAILKEAAPEVLKEVASQVAQGTTETLRKDIEKVIWETVPDLAETIIRKEIEALKSAL